jgi:hypothetical protein
MTKGSIDARNPTGRKIGEEVTRVLYHVETNLTILYTSGALVSDRVDHSSGRESLASNQLARLYGNRPRTSNSKT